jgi:predicted lipoprotein with Yx(FWY)xxD motif
MPAGRPADPAAQSLPQPRPYSPEWNLTWRKSLTWIVLWFSVSEHHFQYRRNNMAQEHDPASSPSVRVRRWAAVALAAGAASASALVVGGAAAASTPGAKLTIVSTSHGKVLSDGTTVYTLKPSSTACGTNCLKIWAAVVLPSGVQQATAGSGVTASKLGTVNVPGIGVQVTYGGKPLYYFYKDKAPGQVKGNITDKWGKWAAVVTSKSGATSNSGSSSAGSGGASF